MFETKPLKTWADEVDEADGTRPWRLHAWFVLHMGLNVTQQLHQPCALCARHARIATLLGPYQLCMA